MVETFQLMVWICLEFTGMFCSALSGHYLPVVGTDRTEGSVNSRNGLEILRENIQKRVSCSVWAVSS